MLIIESQYLETIPIKYDTECRMNESFKHER